MSLAMRGGNRGEARLLLPMQGPSAVTRFGNAPHSTTRNQGRGNGGARFPVRMDQFVLRLG